jgi:hypothetical protein
LGIDKHLRRHGLLEVFEPNAELEDPEDQLAASAVGAGATRFAPLPTLAFCTPNPGDYE